jgi:glycosyltransferase involved in cell wall biosynthesis
MTMQIAIDLTPLRPGGENGGAKTLTWELLKYFHELAPDYTFLLLTAEWNHDELAVFDGPGFSRLCVLSHQNQKEIQPAALRQWEELLQGIRRLLPLSLINRLRPPIQWLKARHRSINRPSSPLSTAGINLSGEGVDLLFCPFTAVTYAEPGLPVISFVHDLQHRIYPQFFDAAEFAGRENTYTQMAHRADVIICNSNYTRQTLLAQFETIKPEQCHVIPISIHSRLTGGNSPELAGTKPPFLEKISRPFLFYPANFWPHKNHRLLLTAYNALLHQRPNLNLDLALTGSPSEAVDQLQTAVAQMNLTGRVHFLGFLPDSDLAAVYQACKGLIYPSLYEGFGIPLLEAFTFNKPVLCSDVTSLPEVAGDAALYFNPRKPAEIIRAIETLLDDPSLEATLIQEGQKRLAQYDPAQMVQRYEACFEQVLVQKMDRPEMMHGRFEDGWLGPEIIYTYQPHDDHRLLTLTLFTPPWHPHPAVVLSYTDPETGMLLKTTVTRGETTTLAVPLIPKGGRLALACSPTFQPAEHEGTTDTRHLSCILTEWKIEV